MDLSFTGYCLKCGSDVIHSQGKCLCCQLVAVTREAEAFIAANCECKGTGEVWPLDSDYPKPCLDCRALRAALKGERVSDEPKNYSANQSGITPPP